MRCHTRVALHSAMQADALAGNRRVGGIAVAWGLLVEHAATVSASAHSCAAHVCAYITAVCALCERQHAS